MEKTGEGFWLFKGATRTHSSMNCYGGPFGSEEASTCIPVCMHRMHANYSWNSKVSPRPNPETDTQRRLTHICE